MIDICGLLLNILKSSTPGLLESGTTKMRQGGDGNGLAVLSRRCRFVNRPAGRFLRVLAVLAALVVWVGAQPASGQTDDDNVRMIPLAPQVEVPLEIGAVEVKVAALGSDATEVEAGGKSSVLIASDADGTLMLAAANEDGGYLGEGPGAVALGIESTAITLVAVASGRRFGEIDPELAQTIRSHEEFGRLTRLLKALMASDKNYLDRLYSYPQAVTLIKSVAAGVASAGAEPSVEAGPGFKDLHGRDVAHALAAAEDIAAYNSETGPIGRLYKDDFYCVPGSGYSFGILPCSAWKDREPWHWYGNALGLRALFPDKWYEWLPVVFGSGVAFPRKYAELVWREAGTPPFLAVSDDTMNGCRSFDVFCKEEGVHATANPNFVSYAMELYEDGVYQGWFYTAGNGTMYAKLRDSGAAYREFRAGPRRAKSVQLSPDIDVVRFQRYRFSFAEGDQDDLNRGAVVSFMNTLHLVISVVNLLTDLSEVRGALLNADVVEQAPTILACSEEVVKALATTVPDLIVDGKFAPDINPEKENSTLILESLRDLAPAVLAGLRTPPCGKMLGATVKGGVSDRVLREAISAIDDLLGPPATRQGIKIGADFLLSWVKLLYDAVNDTIPVAFAYFRPAGDRVDYHLFWDENRNGTPYISSVSKSRPPTVHFTHRQKGGFKVELDASQTEPGDSDDLHYTWRVNGARVGGDRERFVHDFGAAGRYDVELVVIDANRLTGKFSYGVDVIPGTPPEVSSLECTPTRYDTFRMVASFSDEDGDIETVEWRSNAGSSEPDRVTSAGTTQVELRASGGTTWASVIVEDRVGNRGSRVCSVNLEYVPTATLGIDSLSAACGREEPWRACYHRTGMNQGELFEFSVSMPREPTGTWHVAWCAKEEREGLCRGQHDWTTRIDKRFANEAPLTFPMTPPAGAETFWVVAEVRECNKTLCNWPDDFTEVEFHYIEVSVLPPAEGTGGDREVLEKLYDATGGPRWNNSTNWKTAAPLRQWHGVETDAAGRVIGLELGENGLTGAIPKELGNLDRLERLVLWGHPLGGGIPAELGGLIRLEELILNGNNLSGPIPAELGRLTNLKVLRAAQNNLTGPIPASLGNLSRLESLTLGSNNLSGPIPAELSRLTDLQHLGLLGNNLSGPIPAELGRLTSLEELWLNSNNLSGPIPAELGRLTSLEELLLNSNNLSGPIPTELGRLTSLELLWLNSNNLSGQIPAELGRLTSLERLALSYNLLSGELPASLTGLRRLWDFFFNDNAGLCAPSTTAFQEWLDGIRTTRGLTCGSPVEPITDREALVSLYFGTNGSRWSRNANWFSREPLSEWYGVKTDENGRVIELELHNNGLQRRIPTALGSLTQLERLDFSGNNLNGGVPAELGNLTRLEQLDLSGNALSGELPASLTNLRQLINFYFFNDNAGLCAPSTTAFQEWLRGVNDVNGPTCDSTGPTDPKPGETRVFDGIEFVQIPAGQFQMGSTSAEAESDEQPLTQVRISRGFWMGKYEVTQGQWESVVGDNPSSYKDCGEDCPVENISWYEVHEQFIERLNAGSGGRRYRLPTEAEWEYAARAGTTTPNYAGDATGNVVRPIAWYAGNSGGRTHPVGQKVPNAWGLYDILGNVSEWVWDTRTDYRGVEVTDPGHPVGSGKRPPSTPFSNPGSPDKIFRGASYAYPADDIRSARRNWFGAVRSFPDTGFRLVMEGGGGGAGDGGGGDGDLADLSISDPGDWLDHTGTTESRYEDGVLILGDTTRDYDELWSKETFGPGHRLEFDAKIPAPTV